jgi:hypothetical protein
MRASVIFSLIAAVVAVPAPAPAPTPVAQLAERNRESLRC